jgi:hypothetical protein
MNDQIDLMKPWSIKACSSRVSDEVTTEARKMGLTTGQLLEKVWDAWKADGSPVSAPATTTDLAAICDLVRVATDVARVTGKPMRGDLQGRLLGLVDQQIRAARGMPQIPYRPRAPVHNPPPELPTDSVENYDPANKPARVTEAASDGRAS